MIAAAGAGIYPDLKQSERDGWRGSARDMSSAIIVSAPAPRGGELFRDVRQWIYDSKLPKRGGPIEVKKTPDLACAVELARAERQPAPIFVIEGESLSTVKDRVPRRMWRLSVLSGSLWQASTPLATPIAGGPAVVRRLECEHIRKLTVLQGVEPWLMVRCLTTIADLTAYLRLRYRVWTQLNYLRDERNCRSAQLEIDYSDRFSCALGAFARVDGEEHLIGGVRLIRESFDAQGSQSRLIDAVIAASNDDCLARAARRTAQDVYPSDLLPSFSQFRHIYQRWVQERLLKAELSRVIVHPDWRSRGIGEVLVDSAVAYARAQNLNLLYLACKGVHTRFYEASGFRVMPELKCDSFAGVNVPAVGMELRL
ncbi:MAG TPA: GNAT family N-acetyltransferase [Burkholderiales bacterium]|nr:GNAT family N-acetyltransferase [Burkholderiales bacterium]